MATGCSHTSIDLGRINFWHYCPYCDSHIHHQLGLGVKVMVFNAAFKYNSVILWHSVLLLEETGVPGENQ